MTVTVDQKMKFIDFILSSQEFSLRECRWLLKHLKNHSKARKQLERIHFVYDADKTPRGIEMSTVDVDSRTFRYFLNGESWGDPERCYEHVKRNQDDDIYIEIKYEGRERCKMWHSVWEENLYCPINLSDSERDAVDSVLSCVKFDSEMNVLEARIDETLVNGDREAFYKLCEEREHLMMFKPEMKFETYNR
ncbi:hypothetical protein M3_0208 [Lysinibacillus phage vB_LfM_LysYB1]|nr:hypothetical protein M3_0208 [Lysinibacillus phage vB_LfM_LysYB1]WAB25280.1 hypothetical protein M5_0102 [Lysinibacillus phage vB_LfM_LysYB2]